MRVIYTINVNSSRENLKKVLETLFAKGFVFTARRIRTFEKFVEAFPKDYAHGYFGWNWITIGGDIECKMVLDAYTDMPWSTNKAVTLDEFVQLIETQGW